ncbi:MAG: chromate transporter [Acidobacteriota bacterium]|nr:chromate transporter [Acidobacteriota bacterium]
MNPFLLYLLLAKATLTSFSGLTSLPVVRRDLVETRHVLTDRQLNAAVAAGRTAPGPNGLYVVSVGYFVAGVPGAFAGCLAMVTPAFLIIPLLRFLGARAERPAVKSAIQTVTIAAAGLIIAITVPLARDALTKPVYILIAVGSFLFLVLTKLDTLWVMLAAAAISLMAMTVTGNPAP